MKHASHVAAPDVVLIGGGIMSATVGALLKRLEPALTIQVYEVTDELAQESSHGWNNAGTGHAGLCELSYTPDRAPDGAVRVEKAVEVFEQFEQSLQFWSRAVAGGMIERPAEFINRVPHLSFVHGAEQVDFLRARHAALSAHHFFREMQFTSDRAEIGAWAPLLVEGRAAMPVAATRVAGGTDVNFGALARKLFAWLARQEGCGIASGHRVIDLRRAGAAGWEVTAQDLASGERRRNTARFVFVGAGGGSILLLQRSGLPEARGLGGFPIGGQWLVCDNPDLVSRHHAKVYGQALGTAPTMAVPHLDARVIDGGRALLFGPFAAWTTRFLQRQGSWTDLPRSVKPHNLATLLEIAWGNLGLIRYLVQQGTQCMADRMEALHDFHPAARTADWRLIDAGIRVQAIKRTDGAAGIVHYGTEVLTSADRSLSALLGASPGASVSVAIALEIIRRCFPHLFEGEAHRRQIRELVPTFGEDLRPASRAARFRGLALRARESLGLC